MKELFKYQLEKNNPLTEEILNKMTIKKYYNGDKKEVGDIALYAMLVDDIIEKEDNIHELPMKLVELNERHFDQFESHFLNENMSESIRTGERIPVLKLKNMKNKISNCKYKVGDILLSEESGEEYLLTAVGKRKCLVEVRSKNGGCH